MSKVKTNILNLLLIVFTFVLFTSLFLINSVKASDVVFSINRATIKEKSSNVTGSINNNDNVINSDITFNKVGDYVLYEIEFKNNKDNKIIINSINDNNANDYISYEYDKHENYEVDTNGTFTLSIKVMYKTSVNDIDNRNQNNDVSFSINYDDNKQEDVVIINPKTYDGINIYIILAIISIIGIIVCLILKNKKAHSLLLVLIMIPVIVKADSSISNFNIKSNIKLNDQLKVSYTINNQSHEVIVNYGDKLNINFNGVLLENGNVFDINTPITSDLNLIEEEYNITYNLNGGILPDNYPTKYIIENEVTLSNPTKNGYKFLGWTGSNGTTPQVNVKIEEGSMGNKTYTANWELTTYNITYYLDDGVLPDNYPTQYTIETDEFTLSNPTKEGYKFTGWTGTNLDTKTKTVIIPQGTTGAKAYTANWEAETYNITYTLDGGTLPDVHPTSYTIESSAITLVNPTKDGLVFAGWTGSNGTNPQTTVTIPTGSTGDKAYTANWTDEYTVVFHSNNGQDQTHRQVIKFDQEVQLDDNVFTNEDKDFKEWTTNSDGTGVKYTNKRVKYANSARTEMTSTYYKVVNLPIDENLEIHLYAQWQEPNLTKTTFDKGQNVNKIMKQLAGNSESTYTSIDTNIRYIKRATDEEYHGTTANKVSVTSNYYENYYDEPIYMWFDNGTIYYYSEADILYLNETSSYLFNGLTELISIDFTGIDTSIVKNTENMFGKCEKLNVLDLSTFNTSSVTTMQNMFNGCEDLRALNLSSFNTSQVNNMRNMFSGCKELETLDITNFNTFKVTNMSSMFKDCTSLESLDLTSFNTSNVTNMSSMFNNCSSLENLNITSFDTSKVTDMNRMFASMETITSLDLSSFNTESVTNMEKMFSNMKNIETIYASDNFVTTSVTNGNQMFVYDTTNPSIDQPNAKLTGGEGTTYNKNYLGKEYAHIDDPDNGNPGYFTRK